MSRTLTAGTLSEIGAAVTRPGYLVEIDFATILRLSSRGTMPWNGNTYTAWYVQISGVGFDAGKAQGGSLTLGDFDDSISALILDQGIADRAIRIWKIYGETPGPSDAVPLFAGVGDDS